MSKELATTKPDHRVGALAVMAARFNVEPNKLLSTLKGTVFKEARNDEELMALCIVANEYGLNPLTKEIYAFPAKGGGIVPVVSIDGWIRIINTHPQMDGVEFEWNNAASGDPISCTAIIYRKDRNRPIKVTEYFSECSRNTDPWKMKHRMLRHKALIQCGRVAFGFGGVHDEDDARDIAQATVVEIKEPIFSAPVTALPSSSESEEVSASSPAPKATAVQALQNLIKASRIEENDVLAYVFGEIGETYDSIDAMGEQLCKTVVDNWTSVLATINADGGSAK